LVGVLFGESMAYSTILHCQAVLKYPYKFITFINPSEDDSILKLTISVMVITFCSFHFININESISAQISLRLPCKIMNKKVPLSLTFHTYQNSYIHHIIKSTTSTRDFSIFYV